MLISMIKPSVYKVHLPWDQFHVTTHHMRVYTTNADKKSPDPSRAICLSIVYYCLYWIYYICTMVVTF